MRLPAFFLAIALAVTAAAGSLPLTNKEIALMLRSGYSSESILVELTNRRMLEPLDPATKKSIVEVGASPRLIAALESGAYVVTTTEADQVRMREAAVAARKQAQIEQDQKLNTLYQARQAEARARATPAPAAGEALVLDALKSKLVRCHDGTISHADGAELEKKKFVALYYSAHWCGPCRKFTPQLVDYYNRIAAAHPEFELIFVSSDRSRFGWETYIRETKMPWLAIDYDQLGGLADLKKLGGESIPSLLVLDAGSHIIASSYEGEKYLGPRNALDTLDKIFELGGVPIAVR
jgi:nucleoredoxin